eukprot:5120460-Alexandrium_andersonii.AAC.1
MSASLVGSEMCIRDRCRAHPSGASGANFEFVPGPAQFKLRAPEAILRLTHGGLRMEADCSPDEPLADCGLHFGPLAM